MMANFDIDRLVSFTLTEISRFSGEHRDETFYGFAIDANLICFNSIEKFNGKLKSYQQKWGGYNTQEEIQDLKSNTGDWAYQGFATLTEEVGFDMDSYLEHYNAEDEDQFNSAYAQAMDNLISFLKKSDVFDNIRKTSDFYICRVEHNY